MKKHAATSKKTATQQPSTTNKSSIKSKKCPSPKTFENMSQLLHAAYTGAFKGRNLKKEESAAIRSAPKLNKPKRKKLLDLALSDQTLNKTRELMLFNCGLTDAFIKSQLKEFLGEVLKQHPAFQSISLANALKGLPTAPPDDSAIQELASQNYESFSWHGEAGPIKKGEQELCRINAVHCLLLWFKMDREISAERIQCLLQKSLWRKAANKHDTEIKKLRALLSTKDFSAVSIACSFLEKEILEVGKLADRADQEKKRAVSEALDLNKNLSETQAKLTDAESEVKRLEEELVKEKQILADSKAHSDDDYQQLRGRALRCLKNELSLLDEGLDALRSVPPKPHVMIDHAERAIDGLKREMEKLRENH